MTITYPSPINFFLFKQRLSFCNLWRLSSLHPFLISEIVVNCQTIAYALQFSLNSFVDFQDESRRGTHPPDLKRTSVLERELALSQRSLVRTIVVRQLFFQNCDGSLIFKGVSSVTSQHILDAIMWLVLLRIPFCDKFMYFFSLSETFHSFIYKFHTCLFMCSLPRVIVKICMVELKFSKFPKLHL